MAVLTKKQEKFFEKLFYDEAKLQRIVSELHAARVSDAKNSADPTAKETIARLENVVSVMGYDDPAAWLEVAGENWGKYRHTLVGKAMARRYKRREIWTSTCIMALRNKPVKRRNKGGYFSVRRELPVPAVCRIISRIAG